MVAGTTEMPNYCYFCHECDRTYAYEAETYTRLTPEIVRDHYRSQHPDLLNRLQIVIATDEEQAPETYEDTAAQHRCVQILYNGRLQKRILRNDGDWDEYDGEEDDWVEFTGWFLFGGKVCSVTYRIDKVTNIVKAVYVHNLIIADGDSEPSGYSDWTRPMEVKINTPMGQDIMRVERFGVSTGSWMREELEVPSVSG